MKYVSALLTAASGKVRGLVASHNKGGTYFRGKTIPTNPSSPGQVAARSRVASLIARFRTVLTAGQKTSWATFAANTNVIDRLGNSVLLTGPNWYIKSNSIRQQAGFSLIDAASNTFALSTLSPFSGTITTGAGTAIVAWNAVDDWQANSNTAGVLFYASRPQNPTINYFKGPYQYASSVRSTLGSGTSFITLPFPAGTSGSKVFLRAVATAPDGRPSGSFFLPVTVP